MLSQVGDTQADWRGHVIVCGLPGVGLRIVEQLRRDGVAILYITHYLEEIARLRYRPDERQSMSWLPGVTVSVSLSSGAASPSRS